MKKTSLTLSVLLLFAGGVWAEEITLSCKAYYYWDYEIITSQNQKQYESQRASLLINTEEKKVTYSGTNTIEFEYSEDGNTISFKNYNRTVWYTLDRVTGELRRVGKNLSNGYLLHDTKYRCVKAEALF